MLLKRFLQMTVCMKTVLSAAINREAQDCYEKI